MNKCNICPRECNIDRSIKKGFCLASEEIVISKAMLHMWEEPFISGDNGSGAIFFSGCNLRCVFCQNYDISSSLKGVILSEEEIVSLMLKLQEKGAHNINLVTASHYIKSLKSIIIKAKEKGLNIPIVYNSSGYEKVSSLKELEGLIDIYLPDFKYYSNDLALKYSNAKDYVKTCKDAINEMVRQVGPIHFEDDLLKKGIVIRHLILPNHIEDSKDIIEYIFQTFKHDVFISIMNQYTPMAKASLYPEINRKVTEEEYDNVIDFAISIGVENALVQDSESQSDSFTPDFDELSIIKEILSK